MFFLTLALAALQIDIFENPYDEARKVDSVDLEVFCGRDVSSLIQVTSSVLQLMCRTASVLALMTPAMLVNTMARRTY